MEKKREMSVEKVKMVRGRPEKVVVLDDEEEFHGKQVPPGFRSNTSSLDTRSSSITTPNHTSDEERIYCPTPISSRPPKIGNSRIPSKGEKHSKHTLNVNKFISDLLEQNQEHELPCLTSEILVDNRLQLRNDASNIISHQINTLVEVDGYKVKRELAPILKSIFSKYGDIAGKSLFPMETRSCFLEIACSVIKKLEASNFTDLTPVKIQSMRKQVRNLELVGMEVGWLERRLDEIAKAKQNCEDVLVMKEMKKRNLGVIEEKKKAVGECEKELEACLATMKKVLEKVHQEKGELTAAMAENGEICEKIFVARSSFKRFKKSSLVDGLI